MFFTTKIDETIKEADIVFIAVNTPTKSQGVGAGRAADLSYAQLAARTVARVCDRDTIVVEKSTVPVKTALAVEQILNANAKPGVKFQV